MRVFNYGNDYANEGLVTPQPKVEEPKKETDDKAELGQENEGKVGEDAEENPAEEASEEEKAGTPDIPKAQKGKKKKNQ